MPFRVDKSGAIALMYAIKPHPDFEIIKLLVENETYINQRDFMGYTALHECMNLPNIPYKIIKYLIDKGANPKLIDNYGMSILHRLIRGACGNKTQEGIYMLAKLFLEHGVNPNTINHIHNTPLLDVVMYAVPGKTLFYSLRLVKLLLKYGADVRIKDDSGRNALRLATFFHGKNSAVYKLLKAHGAR